ncbi:MAG: D-alanine--D-alanine ligase [Bacteroidales bacterium]
MSEKKSQKKNIAVMAGGNSGEYGISVNSANLILEHINRDLFTPWLVIIKGEEWICETGQNRIPLDRNDFSVTVDGVRIRFDAVFNIIHGTPGEDGMLQGYLDMMGVSYTSCGRLTSSLTFNKYACSRFVTAAECVNIADAVLIRHGAHASPDEILAVTGLPCFVKPNNGGSSVGMSKVKEAAGLEDAIHLAFEEDDEVLVEAFIGGTEVTCGVFSRGGKVIVLPITEIVPKTEYFDFEAKYHGKSDEITPARIAEKDETEVKRVSALLYRYLGCKGIVRFDYILSDRGLFFLEANTVPGMSKESIVPQQLAHHGLSVTDFITGLIEDALVG